MIQFIKLYFLIQHVKVEQSPLIPEIPLNEKKNILISFSDGSSSYSTSTTYFICAHKQSDLIKTILLSINSKLHNTKLLDTILEHKVHSNKFDKTKGPTIDFSMEVLTEIT